MQKKQTSTLSNRITVCSSLFQFEFNYCRLFFMAVKFRLMSFNNSFVSYFERVFSQSRTARDIFRIRILVWWKSLFIVNSNFIQTQKTTIETFRALSLKHVQSLEIIIIACFYFACKVYNFKWMQYYSWQRHFLQQISDLFFLNLFMFSHYGSRVKVSLE